MRSRNHLVMACVPMFLGMLAACSTFSGAEGAPSDDGGSDAADAGVVESDASADGDAITTQPVDAGTNLAANGDFEQGCAGWPTTMGTATGSDDPHGGTSSCQVCVGGGGAFSIGQVILRPVPNGAELDVAAWVKLPSTPFLGVLTVEPIFDTFTAEGVQLDEGLSPCTAVTDVWQKITGLVIVAHDGVAKTSIRFQTADTVPPGACFLLDDVVVTQRQ